LTIASPTSGGRSVGIVRSRTQTMEFFLQLLFTHNVSLQSSFVARGSLHKIDCATAQWVQVTCAD
jgi:hypothetical protein